MDRIETNAAHEAGHAVIAEALGISVVSVTVAHADPRLGGQTEFDMPALDREEPEQAERALVALFAGYVAECCVSDRLPGLTEADDAAAINECLSVLPGDKEAHCLRAWGRAVTAVQTCKPMLDAVTAMLMEEKTLTGYRLRQVLKPYDLTSVRAGLTAILF